MTTNHAACVGEPPRVPSVVAWRSSGSGRPPPVWSSALRSRIVCERWICIALFAFNAASCSRSSGKLTAEVERVQQALAAATGTTTPRKDPERGLFSASWSWRFHAARPAAPLRQALVRSLEPRFACTSERRHVRCSRALGGDSLHFDVAAHPAEGGTLVKAELRATPY